MSVRQAVLGCGRWGSFHLWYGSRTGHSMVGWEPAGNPQFNSLMRTRENRYLKLPEDILLTTDLKKVEGADVLICTAPAQHFRDLCRRLTALDLSRSDLVLCMKGIEKGTGMRLSRIARQEGLVPGSICVWVGPGHPQQFVAGVPSCMIVASEDEEAALRISEMFSSRLIRFYRSRDLIGCEVGAALKNVVGIAAGMLDGLNMSGLKGALMARAPHEVARLISAMGGDWRSVYGLSHLGDYEATLFSPLSHNRMYGEAFAMGNSEGCTSLAEGVDTATAVLQLSRKLNVEMPITETVTRVIAGEIPVEGAIEKLFERPQKEEFAEGF